MAPPALVRLLIVLSLVFLVASQMIPTSAVTGFDFYHFWGVAVAKRLGGQSLGSPYADGKRYATVLGELAAVLNQPKLDMARQFWKRPDFTATPLLYLCFAFVSSDYAFALGIFHILQIVAFLTAILIIGLVCGYERFHLSCLALLLVLTFGPLGADLRMANVGAFQLYGMAVLLALAHLLDDRGRTASILLGAVFLGALGFLVLSKPNVLLIAILMLAGGWKWLGFRSLALSAVPALLFCAGLVALTCNYFGSCAVWRDWFHAVPGNAHTMIRPISQGNYATPLLLSSSFGWNVSTVSIVICVSLVASMMGALAAHRSSRVERAGWRSLPGSCHRLFENPTVVMAIGVTATIALSPLVWYHYYVLALVPALWLLNIRTRTVWPCLLGLAALVMSSGMLLLIFHPLGWSHMVPGVIGLSWLPLWIGILLCVVSNEDPEGQKVKASTPANPSQRPTKARNRRAQ